MADGIDVALTLGLPSNQPYPVVAVLGDEQALDELWQDGHFGANPLIDEKSLEL